MLGQTQLNWFEQSLVAAQAKGVTWKFVAMRLPRRTQPDHEIYRR
jgi:hypothetical protein